MGSTKASVLPCPVLQCNQGTASLTAQVAHVMHPDGEELSFHCMPAKAPLWAAQNPAPYPARICMHASKLH